MVLHPLTHRNSQESEELRKQAFHYDIAYHLIYEIVAVRKRNGAYELQVKWIGLQAKEDMSWGPLQNIRDDGPGIPEDFLHKSGDRNLKREIIDL